MHKAGFVNIIGNPNVGKSTLMNAMLGEKLSIATSKAQTTRHRIKGIVSGDDYQIIFSDTPGILQPKYKLQLSMLNFVEEALSDADIILYVTDPRDSERVNEEYVERLNKMQVELIVIINKIDKVEQEAVKLLINQWQKRMPKAEIIPASALYNFNIDKIFHTILEKLPESPPFFDKDTLTDRPLRFFVAELIREKIFEFYKQEIPYSTEVVIDSFKEYPHITKIRAIIFVEKESQKPILIGHGGLALKKVGIAARKDIEKFLNTKVYLEMYVKVDKNWRNNVNKLKKFGFNL